MSGPDSYPSIHQALLLGTSYVPGLCWKLGQSNDLAESPALADRAADEAVKPLAPISLGSLDLSCPLSGPQPPPTPPPQDETFL